MKPVIQIDELHPRGALLVYNRDKCDRALADAQPGSAEHAVDDRKV
jgi:hypothetical protein